MSKGTAVPEGVGIVLRPGANTSHTEYQVTRFLLRLGSLGWCRSEMLDTPTGPVLRLRLRTSLVAKFVPGFDTLSLRQRLLKSMARQDEQVLMREVWVAMLCAPVRMDFADLDELAAHLRIRCNIARAAEKTALAFKTHAAERPADFWHDEPHEGFLLKPEVCLVDALIAATQPERTGRLYDFLATGPPNMWCFWAWPKKPEPRHPIGMPGLSRLPEKNASSPRSFMRCF